METMKEHIEHLEDAIGLKILNVKEIKEMLAIAENETLQIEEQLRQLTRTGRQPGCGGR